MAGKKIKSLQYMSESEALRRVRMCAKDMVSKLEELNGRALPKRKRKLLLQTLKDTVLLVFAKKFDIVPDTDDRVRKNPR